MTFIELPRALEDYFAFAETEPTRRGRRFSISLPYFQGQRLDRLQWWYHVTPVQEQMFDGQGLVVLRTRAIERFRRHIEQWLANTHQQLHGDDPIPRLSPRTRAVDTATPPSESRALAEVIPLPVARAAVNG